MKTISQNVAEWVTGTGYDRIPPEMIAIAKRNILDWVGVALAGSRQPIAEKVKQYLTFVRGADQSSVVGLGIKTSCTEAAFGNGILGHCLDYDDLLRPVLGAGGPHITAAILPAALAVAELRNKSGKELIEAYTLGCEVTYRVGRAVDPDHYNTGWHTTQTEGIFGATVAASKLLELKADQLTFALGIAASEASGLLENAGTMTKSFHAGQSCAKGLRAALLASWGYDSSSAALEGKFGFFNVMAKRVKPEEVTRNIGEPFCLSQIVLKPYPCCGGILSPIYAALELAKKNDISIDNIESVEVLGDPQITPLLDRAEVRTGLDGKFSIQYCVALALAERKVTLEGFTNDKIKDPTLVNLMNKTKVISDSRMIQTIASARSSVVEVKLKDGSKLSNRCDFTPGTPQNPLPLEELLGKYRDCARLALPEPKIKESIELLLHLEDLSTVKSLSALIGTSEG